jgi:hypothetical protein
MRCLHWVVDAAWAAVSAWVVFTVVALALGLVAVKAAVAEADVAVAKVARVARQHPTVKTIEHRTEAPCKGYVMAAALLESLGMVLEEPVAALVVSLKDSRLRLLTSSFCTSAY